MKDLTNEIVVHIKKENCEFLQFRKLLEYKDVCKHAYGIKPGNFRTYGTGVDSEKYENAMENYKSICNSIGVNSDYLTKPNQSHTNTVSVAKIGDIGIINSNSKFENTDGLITNTKNVVLATSNADCIILILYDPIKNVIGNVHSGWRGTFQKIAVNAVKKMITEFNCKPENIICCICPSIRKCHFEVENDVKQMCEDIFGYTNRIDEFIEYKGIKDGKEKWLIDTVLINKIILQEVGIKLENIVDSGICSVCNCDNVHSYRVERQGFGLNTAIISLN